MLAAQALVLQAQADSLAVANEFGSLLQVSILPRCSHTSTSPSAA